MHHPINPWFHQQQFARECAWQLAEPGGLETGTFVISSRRGRQHSVEHTIGRALVRERRLER